jgi:small subunit ribosomal protein S20
MANHKSAIKRNRQNIVRRARNRSERNKYRTAVKNVLGCIKAPGQNQPEAGATLAENARIAESKVAKAAAKGILKKKTASRIISRLFKKINTSKAAATL